jgi:hypothetical protein
MSEPQRPSLGRIVHFYHAGCERSFVAIVTGTAAEGCRVTSPMHVNLRIDWDDTSYGEWSGNRNIPYSDVPKGGHWHWPPRV